MIGRRVFDFDAEMPTFLSVPHQRVANGQIRELRPEPRAKIVEMLENALREAKSSDPTVQLESIALAGVCVDGSITFWWSIGGSTIALAGAVARVWHRLNLKLDQTATVDVSTEDGA